MIDLGTGRQALVDTGSTGPRRRSVRTTARVLVMARGSLRDARRGDGRADRRACRAATCPGRVERLVAARDGRTVIVIAGKPRARVVALATGTSRIGRVKQAARGHRRGVRAVRTNSSRVAGHRPDRTALGHAGPGSRPSVLARSRRARSCPSRSTGRAPGRHREHRSDRARLAQRRPVSSSPRSSVTRRLSKTCRSGPTASARHGERRRDRADVGRERSSAPGARTGTAARLPRRCSSAATPSSRSGRTARCASGIPGRASSYVPTRSAGPSAPRQRARSARWAVVAVAVGSDVRLQAGGGGTSSPRSPGSRQLRVVQPGRSLARHRRARPRRHRLGRRERRAGPSFRRGAFGVCRGRPVQPGRTVDRDGRARAPPGIWQRRGRKTARYLYGPTSPLTAVAFGPDSRTVVSTREEDGTVRRYVCELCGGPRRADGPRADAAPSDRAHAHRRRSRPLPRLPPASGADRQPCHRVAPARAAPEAPRRCSPPRYVAGQVPLTSVDADAP